MRLDTNFRFSISHCIKVDCFVRVGKIHGSNKLIILWFVQLAKQYGAKQYHCGIILYFLVYSLCFLQTFLFYYIFSLALQKNKRKFQEKLFRYFCNLFLIVSHSWSSQVGLLLEIGKMKRKPLHRQNLIRPSLAGFFHCKDFSAKGVEEDCYTSLLHHVTTFPKLLGKKVVCCQLKLSQCSLVLVRICILQTPNLSYYPILAIFL